MLIAEALSGLQLILVGLSMLVGAFVLRRTIVLGRRLQGRDLQKEVRDEAHEAGRSATSLVRQMEVRLHDYGREVEGRTQTRIAVLDELVLNADREIERLRKLLAESSRIRPSKLTMHRPDVVGPGVSGPGGRSNGDLPPAGSESARPLTAEQHRMIHHLATAGYTADQIARLLDRPQREIRTVLGIEKGSRRADAA